MTAHLDELRAALAREHAKLAAFHAEDARLTALTRAVEPPVVADDLDAAAEQRIAHDHMAAVRAWTEASTRGDPDVPPTPPKLVNVELDKIRARRFAAAPEVAARKASLAAIMDARQANSIATEEQRKRVKMTATAQIVAESEGPSGELADLIQKAQKAADFLEGYHVFANETIAVAEVEDPANLVFTTRVVQAQLHPLPAAALHLTRNPESVQFVRNALSRRLEQLMNPPEAEPQQAAAE